MAETAYQRQYRDEFIAGFEDGQSRLRTTCITETQTKGNEAIFLVADSGSATATTRGVNGMLPARADNNSQLTCTLREWHDLVRKTGFNIFASQGDQRRLMRQTTMKVLNRKIDDDIIEQLDTATNDTSTAQKATLDLVVMAKTILGNNFVPTEEEDDMFAVISPAFEGYLMQIPEYASSLYVDSKPFNGTTKKYRRWFGVNWIIHPRLTGSVGAGSSGTSEKCYMYHRNAIGHAFASENLKTALGYDEEHDYSYARVTAYMGSKLLQNSGVVQMLHDGSAYVAS